MNKVICIIQAHTTSKRLPNKVFKDLGGQPMLYHVVERVRRAKKVNEIVVATTVEKEDNIIEKFCIENNIKHYRGSDENVLSRYYEAAKLYNADTIVRITSDCPLISPNIIDEVVDFFNNSKFDYLSPSSDSGLIRGLDTEVFSIETLKRAYELATDHSEKEHVTLYMYRNPEIFNIGTYLLDKKYRNKDIRLCVDEEDDYKLMKHIYEKFYKSDIIDINEIIDYLNLNHEITFINKKVKQKEV